MLFLLLSTFSAHALDDRSLRSRGSYGLFRDPVDFLSRPALVPVMSAWDVYAGMDGLVGDGHVGGGGVGPLGGGLLGVLVDGAWSRDRSEHWAPYGDAYQVSLDHVDTSDVDALIGWAAPLGGGRRLGVRLRGWRTTDARSVQPERWSDSLDFHSAGEQTWRDGQLVASATGERRRQVRGLTGSVGLGGPTRGGVHLGLSASRATSRVTGSIEDELGTYEIDGAEPSATLATNRALWQPILGGEWRVPLGDGRLLRLQADGVAGWGHVADRRLRMQGETGGMDEELTYTITDDRYRAWGVEALAVLQIERDTAALRVGLRGSYGWSRSEWRVTSEGFGAGDDALHFDDVYSGLVRLPVAVEVPASSQVTLRLGGEGMLYFADGLVGDPDDPGWADGASATTFTTVWARASVGLRWDPAPALSLDGQVSTSSAVSDDEVIDELSSSGAGSRTYDLSTVSLWVTLHL